MGFNSAFKGLMSLLEEETNEFDPKLIYLIKEKKGRDAERHGENHSLVVRRKMTNRSYLLKQIDILTGLHLYVRQN